MTLRHFSGFLLSSSLSVWYVKHKLQHFFPSLFQEVALPATLRDRWIIRFKQRKPKVCNVHFKQSRIIIFSERKRYCNVNAHDRSNHTERDLSQTNQSDGNIQMNQLSVSDTVSAKQWKLPWRCYSAWLTVKSMWSFAQHHEKRLIESEVVLTWFKNRELPDELLYRSFFCCCFLFLVLNHW